MTAPEPDVAPSEAASAGVGDAKRLPLRPAPVSPDCADGYKCTACTGDAWDLTGDRPAHCTCPCHDVTHSGGAG